MSIRLQPLNGKAGQARVIGGKRHTRWTMDFPAAEEYAAVGVISFNVEGFLSALRNAGVNGPVANIRILGARYTSGVTALHLHGAWLRGLRSFVLYEGGDTGNPGLQNLGNVADLSGILEMDLEVVEQSPQG